MALYGPSRGDAYVLNRVCQPFGQHERAFVQREEPKGLVGSKADVGIVGFVVEQLAYRCCSTAILDGPEHVERVDQEIWIVGIPQILKQEWHNFGPKTVQERFGVIAHTRMV